MSTVFEFFRNHEFARVPKKAYPSDSGYDICSCEHADIAPKQWKVIRTGIQCKIPDGYEIQIRSRSGLAAKKGLFVMNSPGTIDTLYTGEIQVILMNLGEFPFHVSPGDKIAQMVPQKVENTEFVEIKDAPTNDSRGSNGFGSTGVQSK